MQAAPEQNSVDKIIQPGRDSAVHTKNLQNNVSRELQSYGISNNAAFVEPVEQQHPLDAKNEARFDLEDTWNGIVEGKPRDEPSKKFLGKFLERLRKKNPDKEIIAT